MPLPEFNDPISRLKEKSEEAMEKFEDEGPPFYRDSIYNSLKDLRKYCDLAREYLDHKDFFAVKHIISRIKMEREYLQYNKNKEKLINHGLYDYLMEALNEAIYYLKGESGLMNMDGGRRRGRGKGRKSRKINRRKSRKGKSRKMRSR